MRGRHWLTAVALLVLSGCAGDVGGPLLPFALQNWMASNRIGEVTPPPVPAPVSLQATPAATTPSPAPSPSAPPYALIPLPEGSGKPAGLELEGAKALAGKEYLAADFTCKYPATWTPYPPDAAAQAKGQVMWLESDYNIASIIAYASKATATLDHYYSGIMAGVTTEVDSTMVTLGGQSGFQIKGKAYFNGQELDKYVLGFMLGDRYVMLLMEIDPATKDKAILDEELTYILANWSWKSP